MEGTKSPEFDPLAPNQHPDRAHTTSHNGDFQRQALAQIGQAEEAADAMCPKPIKMLK
jgi:hypothetical protein